MNVIIDTFQSDLLKALCNDEDEPENDNHDVGDDNKNVDSIIKPVSTSNLEFMKTLFIKSEKYCETQRTLKQTRLVFHSF